jgi:hypothetical protein
MGYNTLEGVDHEEGTIEEEATDAPGRVGTTVS